MYILNLKMNTILQWKDRKIDNKEKNKTLIVIFYTNIQQLITHAHTKFQGSSLYSSSENSDINFHC